MNTVFVTGATGFIGREVCLRLSKERWQVKAGFRLNEDFISLPEGVIPTISPSLSPEANWSETLKGVHTVIHLAARVHIMQETAIDPLLEFRKANLYGTERLAQHAAEAGVKRLVFMSTIGVNGNSSGENPFTENDDPHPHNPYSVSKLEAEICLKNISAKTGMEVVIVRAPLVYGPKNPGNFLPLLRTIAKGLPLPLASIQNQKSFVYVENLADALICCATHSKAAGKMFLVCDGEDISTPELVRRIAFAMERSARLIPFPSKLMSFIGRLSGKSAAVEQLVGYLQVDSSKIRRELGWVPPFTMDQGLNNTAKWFLKYNT